MSAETETVLFSQASIGAVVLAWRRYRGMTGTELAQKAELDKSYVWQLENDYIKQPKGAILERLAAALKIRVETLTLRVMPSTETARPTSDMSAPTQATVPIWNAGEAEDTEPVRGIEVVVKAWFVKKHVDSNERGTYPIRGKITTIGREPAQSDIVLTEPYVSRVHARVIETEPGEFWLHDGSSPHNPSKNGTLVNDEQLAPGGCVKLKNGDLVRIGDSFLEFHCIAGSESDRSNA